MRFVARKRIRRTDTQRAAAMNLLAAALSTTGLETAQNIWWLQQATIVENVAVRREGNVLFLPAGLAFRLDHEIKNVVTAVAKTTHYWLEHRAGMIDAARVISA